MVYSPLALLRGLSDVLGSLCSFRSSLLRGAAVAVNSRSWAELGWFRALAGQNRVF